MNADLEKIRSFVYKRHLYRVAGMAVERLLYTFLTTCLVIILLSSAFAFYPLTILPFLLDAVLVATGCIVIGILVDLIVIHRPCLNSTATILEHSLKDLLPHPLLEISLELSSDKRTDGFYDEVYRQAVQQIPMLHKVRTAASTTRLHRCGIAAICLFLGAGLLLIQTPDLFAYWRLPFTMSRSNEIIVFPGTVNVPVNGSIRLQLVPHGLPAPSCILQCEKTGQGKRITRLLRADSTGIFYTVFDSLKESFVYQFVYGTYHTKPETVTVVPPPQLHDLHILLKPPSYTRLPQKQLPQGQGDFSAYSGSEAHITIVSPGLSSASIRYASDTIQLDIDDTIASGMLTVKRSGTYSLSLQDTFMQLNDSSGLFSIETITDEVPRVRFLRPGMHKNLEPAEIETLLVESSDDLGIQRLTLYWCKNDGCDTGQKKLDLSPPAPVPVWQKQFIWKISRLKLYPGDTLFYWASATDTKSFGRKQTATTDTFWFRFPTFEEMHRAMAQRNNQAGDLMTSVQQSHRELSQQVDQLDKATKRPDTPSWDRQQLAQGIEKTMHAQADSLQEALKQLEENANKLRKEGALGEDLARKLEEIRKAVSELVDLYGDSLLFPKNQSGEISLDDMRQAVDKLQQMLPELDARLDNTIKYLEALKHDHELAMLAMRAEKLAEEEAQLAENAPSPQTAARQQQLLERIDNFKKDVHAQSADQTQSSSQTMQKIDSASTQMRSQLSRAQTPSANEIRQMSGNLASLAQNLREQTNSFKMQQMEALRNGLLDMSANALSLASWQDDISAEAPTDETSRRRQAQAQQALREGIGYLKQELDSLPMLPPSFNQKLSTDIDAAQEASKAAVESMNSSDGIFGMQVSANTLRQVARSALAMLDAMGKQGDGSCQTGGGMQESLRRMSGKQAAINAATAQLLRAMLEGHAQSGESGGEGEGSAANERARKEAQAAQQALAEELKKLGEKFGDPSGENMRKKIDELEKEARSLSRMLNEPREEVTERQDRFLARMLQSALSLHREDEGKDERKSKSSGIIFSPTTGTVDDSVSGRNDLFYLLRRNALLKGNYPPSYRASINAYFDSLSVLYLKPQ